MGIADFLLGIVYFIPRKIGDSFFDKRKYEKALHYLQFPASLGHPKSLNRLGYIYRKGCKKIPIDYKKAKEYYQKSAEKGFAQAQFNLSNWYYKGYNGELDFEESLKWLEKAVAQGHQKAQNRLGYMHKKGLGIPVNYENAFHYYKLSADQGYITALANVGRSYYFGEGVEQDFSEAFKYFEQAANKDYLDAQYYLGVLYIEGKGVKQDIETGKEWILKAAIRNQNEAQYYLGLLHLQSDQNYKKAKQWFQKSFLNGNKDVLLELGDIARIENNPDEAKKNYQLALQYGNTEAQQRINKMELNIPLPEFDESQNRLTLSADDHHQTIKEKISSLIARSIQPDSDCDTNVA